MLNLDSYPGTSCLSRWNGGLPLISGLSQEKTLNSGMGNSNRVTEIDTVSSHSPYDKLSDSNFHERCTSGRQSGTVLRHYYKFITIIMISCLDIYYEIIMYFTH